MQHNWLGIEGIKIEFYAHDGNAELQDLVNNFIGKHEGNIIDIQYSSNIDSFSCMIVYREGED